MVSRSAMRETLLDAFEDVGEMVAGQLEQMQALLRFRRDVERAWEEMGLGEAPEMEISARMTGLLEPREKERAS
jgi:hypothetical protein